MPAGQTAMDNRGNLGLLNWSGDFGTHGWEKEFQAMQARSGAARMRVVCIASGLAYLAAAYANYLILGASTGFFILLALRIIVFSTGLANFFIASRERLYGLLPYTLAVYMALVGIGEATELLIQSEQVPSEGVPFAAIIVLMFYAFLPLRILPTAVAAIFTSILFVAMLGWGTQASQAYVVVTSLFFLLANIFGVYFMVSFGRAQRNEFKALCEERQANKLLHQEIAQRKEMERRLRDMATTDDLTGVSNRGHFFELSRRELSRAYRRSLPFSVLMIDADNFKTINDQLGHEAGDSMLKALAGTCLRELRQEDIFGRLGGEEFAACLPDTSLEQAKIVAERIRRAVELLKVETTSGQAQVTLSIGIASKGEDRLDLAQFLSQADRELYRAKAAGRNRVMPNQTDRAAKVRAIS